MKLEKLAESFVGKLDKPLSILDIETTGFSHEEDEILQFAAVKIHPDGSYEQLEYYFKPSKPIPEESSKIHGIYDKDVAKSPAFSVHAKDIFDFLNNTYLSGFNVIKFDIPFLSAQLEKNGIKKPFEDSKVFDVMKIYHKHAPRDLSSCVSFYTKNKMENAHNAMSDVIATIECAAKQLDVENKSVAEIIPQDQIGDGFHIILKEGVPYINFGKYKGTQLDKVDKSFLSWVLSKDFPDKVKAYIKKYV